MTDTVANRSSYVDSYLDLNYQLAETIVIKSGVSADVLNQYLIDRYGSSTVDLSNPKSWKYYLNISGEYHPVDTQMIVTSLDTLVPIAFTKENLKTHTATAAAYDYGTRYYYSLLDKYPDQEQLILGILHPVDIDAAIAAEEGSILGYPEGLVEDQEITLIHDLEVFIKRYLVRWNVKDFGLTDSLYNTAYHAQLYMTILPKLLNLRLARCKTNEAHSFHIREYLASHGHLDRFYPYMTLKQALYFYRNINYIFRNAGKNIQYRELIQKILTDRGIPLNEFSIRQLAEVDENYYSKVVARRRPVNDQINAVEKDYVELSVLRDKEIPLVYGNQTYYDNNFSDITHTLQTSHSSIEQTKDLESAMVDYSDSQVDALSDILLREFSHLALTGLYNVVVNFKDPATGETRSLYAPDALLYMYYATLRSYGVIVDKVPKYLILKYRKMVLPTLQEMMSVADSRFRDLPILGRNILSGQPKTEAFYSNSAFYDYAYKLFTEADRHWRMVSTMGDEYKRAILSRMCQTLYDDGLFSFSNDGEDISSWLARNNLPAWTFSYEQATELVRNIFEAATDSSIDDTKVLKNIQKQMLALFTELSSYSIQTISEINSNGVIPLNWSMIRMGDPKVGLSSTHTLPIYTEVQEVSATIYTAPDILEIPTKFEAVKEAVIRRSYSYDITVKPSKSISRHSNIVYDIGNIGVLETQQS